MNELIVPYCERLVSGAEPLNTASNLVFALPLLWGVARLHFNQRTKFNRQIDDRPSSIPGFDLTVALLPLAIGAGSAVFHHSPSSLTHALDVGAFVIFALLVAWRFFELTNWTTTRIGFTYSAWIAASLAATVKPDILAHSLFYVPTFVLLGVLALSISCQHKKFYWLVALFGCALMFRALDLQLCTSAPYGTHILWHLFTALACILCIDIAIPRTSNHQDREKPQTTSDPGSTASRPFL